jgi:hypothetical protein
MTTSYTRTDTETFNLTHAKHLASKVAADLDRCKSRYGGMTSEAVYSYERELVTLLHGGYVMRYEFGFRRDGKVVVCWRYDVAANGDLITDENAGKLVAGVDVSGATYYNHLWLNPSWDALDAAERAEVAAALPFTRASGPSPDYGSGYWTTDKSYSSGGVGINRKTFNPFN